MAEAKLLTLYVTAQGNAPFEDWIEALRDAQAKKRIDARLARVEAGNLGDAKAVGEGVSELRIDYGPGYRVYFGQDGLQIVLLLCGGTKKTQTADIKQAKVYWENYQERKKKQ